MRVFLFSRGPCLLTTAVLAGAVALGSPSAAAGGSAESSSSMGSEAADSVMIEKPTPIPPRVEEREGHRGPSPRGALFRSTVVPGWGQLSTGHPWKAGIFSLAAAALGAGTARETQLANEEVRRANAAETQDEFLFHQQLAEDHRGRRSTYVSWLLTLWLYNMLDAYVEAHFVDFDVAPADPGAEGYKVSMSSRVTPPVRYPRWGIELRLTW